MSRGGAALVLRAADRVALAWKNGGGVTREVAAHPPASDLDSFDWRVSIAEVRSGGPFSVFPGVHRRLAVLEGCLTLVVEGQYTVRLTPDSAPVTFAGDVPASAEPVAPGATDLNVMTRRGRYDSRVTRCVVCGTRQLECGPGTTLILALAELVVRCGGTPSRMSGLDAARIEGAAGCEVLASAPGASFYLIELRPCVDGADRSAGA